MKCSAIKGCENEGVYPLTNGTSDKLYYRCKQHHREFMKLVMRKRYATPEGKKAQAEATKRYLQRKKLAPLQSS